MLGVARERADLDLMLLGDAEPGRLLDVGSGDGARLAQFRSLGWDVRGIESDPEAAASRPELPVHVGTLDDAPFEPGRSTPSWPTRCSSTSTTRRASWRACAGSWSPAVSA